MKDIYIAYRNHCSTAGPAAHSKFGGLGDSLDRGLFVEMPINSAEFTACTAISVAARVRAPDDSFPVGNTNMHPVDDINDVWLAHTPTTAWLRSRR